MTLAEEEKMMFSLLKRGHDRYETLPKGTALNIRLDYDKLWKKLNRIAAMVILQNNPGKKYYMGEPWRMGKLDQKQREKYMCSIKTHKLIICDNDRIFKGDENGRFLSYLAASRVRFIKHIHTNNLGKFTKMSIKILKDMPTSFQVLIQKLVNQLNNYNKNITTSTKFEKKISVPVGTDGFKYLFDSKGEATTTIINRRGHLLIRIKKGIHEPTVYIKNDDQSQYLLAHDKIYKVLKELLNEYNLNVEIVEKKKEKAYENFDKAIETAGYSKYLTAFELLN